ncbi:hypothetical protein JCM8202v2_004738 [Rhodotorula sphaerocarpa]
MRALAGTATDGTTALPRFIQDQLVKLYNIVVSNREELVQALRAGGLSETESEIEAAQSLAHIQALGLHELDFLAYKKKREARMRKDGVIEKGRGVMVIQADPGAGLFSTIVPLATAIAGSNGAIILLASLPDPLKTLLRAKLTAALDRSAFLFDSDSSLEALVAQEILPADSLLVARNAPASSSVSLGSQPGRSGATVLVDRLRPSPLLPRLARLVVRGTVHGGGRLSGSVARVLVHIETAPALVDALLMEIRAAYGSDPALSSDLARCATEEDAQELVREVRREVEKGAGRILCGGALERREKGNLVAPTLVENPSRDFLSRTLAGPVCSIATFGSHEDALCTLASIDTQALFAFSDEQETLEYLAQETDVRAFYANDIPLGALYDPLRVYTDVARYQRQVHYAPPPRLPSALADSLFAPFTPARRALLAKLLPKTAMSLRRTKFAHPILRVFFLQGVFLTVGTVLTVMLGSTGYGLYSLARRFLFPRNW